MHVLRNMKSSNVWLRWNWLLADCANFCDVHVETVYDKEGEDVNMHIEDSFFIEEPHLQSQDAPGCPSQLFDAQVLQGIRVVSDISSRRIYGLTSLT
jgi:hypothetical protein